MFVIFEFFSILRRLFKRDDTVVAGHIFLKRIK